MSASPDMAVNIARVRWRSAEDRLFPALLGDPNAYQRGVAAVQAVVEELRRRDAGVAELLAVEVAPGELLAVACPSGAPISVDLLVGVACCMRDRELTALEQGRRREEAVRAAREAGAAWAVLDGPAELAELTAGKRVTVHLDSGTVVEAIVDEWARDGRFGLSVMHGEPRSFVDRDAWLAEAARVEAEIAGTADPAP